MLKKLNYDVIILLLPTIFKLFVSLLVLKIYAAYVQVEEFFQIGQVQNTLALIFGFLFLNAGSRIIAASASRTAVDDVRGALYKSSAIIAVLIIITTVIYYKEINY